MSIFKALKAKTASTWLGLILSLGIIGAMLYYVFFDPEMLTITFTIILLVFLAAGVTLMFGKWESFDNLFKKSTGNIKIK